ncbi:MAG: acetyl-CoA decarbonylase/synthase complex subunit gamma [Candidatus Altiarchaeota archaeon]
MFYGTPLEVYEFLPHLDCGDCGLSSCIRFAVKLSDREKSLESCPHLEKKQAEGLRRCLKYSIRQIDVGVGKNSVVFGGEDVAYRHEKRFFHPPPIFLELSDTMSDDELKERIDFVSGFRPKVKGKTLHLDGFLLSESMGDAGFFLKLIRALEDVDFPLILKSKDLSVLAAALEVVGGRNPLIYGANQENFESVAKLALKHDCPVVLCGNDLEGLEELSEKMQGFGVSDIVFQVPMVRSDLADTTNRLYELRKEGLGKNPLFSFPVLTDLTEIGFMRNELDSAFHESVLASVCITRYAGALALSSRFDWSLLSVLIFREDLYSDPKKRPTVESKLYSVGSPDKRSPVLVTSNFSATFYSVNQDLEDSSISAHLLAVDTGGLAVTVALASGILTAAKIKDAIDRVGLEEVVGHKKLIIPGDAAQIAPETELLTGWSVEIGPRDSGEIKSYLEKMTNP